MNVRVLLGALTRNGRIDCGTPGASARRMYRQARAVHSKRRLRWHATGGAVGLTAATFSLAATPGPMSLGMLLLGVGAGGGIAEELYTRRHGATREAGISWRIGAEGEEATGRLVKPMARRGWIWLHDRGSQGRMYNIDHLGIPPDASALAAVESKKWQSGWTVDVDARGRLVCGSRLQEKDVESFMREADEVAAAMQVPVVRVMAIHGAGVRGGHLRIRRRSRVLDQEVDIYVLPADILVASLDSLASRAPDPHAAYSLAQRTATRFPRRTRQKGASTSSR